MLNRFLWLLALVLANPLALGSPPEAVAAALADAKALPPGIAQRTLYLDLSNLPEADREETRLALAFHCNSLSREAVLTKPRDVTATLVAVNLDDYLWEAKTLLELFVAREPYYHVAAEKTSPATTDAYGRQVPGVKREIQIPAPWLNQQDYVALHAAMNTEVPILRADWFIYRTAVAADRGKAGYYDWLGLGKAEKDFQALVGADVVAARRLKKEMAAVVGRSLVTLQNRSITRMQSITGPYWFTQDYKTSKDKQNTLRLLDGNTEPPAGDAGEQYGTLPNGLFAFWLQNDKGERQDAAPDFIASDSQAHNTDRRVHVGLSCVRCHVEGIRPINDWARRVYQGQVQLVSPDYAKLKRLKQLYLSDLAGQIADDQTGYARALKNCNGLTPAANARGYAAVFARYEADLELADVARELAVTPEALTEAIKGYGPPLDPLMAGLIQKPPIPLRREHAEELWPALYAAIGKGRAKP